MENQNAIGVIGVWGEVGRSQVGPLNHQRKGGRGHCDGWQRQHSYQNSMACGDVWHWLEDQGVPRSEINSFLICISRRVVGQVNKSLTPITKADSHSPSVNSKTWASSQTWNALNKGRSQVPLKKNPGTLPKFYTVNLSPILLRIWLSTSMTTHCRNENNQTYWALLDTDSEPTPGNSKCHFRHQSE